MLIVKIIPDTPQSSPSRRRLTTRKIQIVWSTIKKFSPVQRLKNSARNRRRKLLENGGRLYASHPDVSCSNLAELAYVHKRSHDDMDVLALARNSQPKESLLSSLQQEQAKLISETRAEFNEEDRTVGKINFFCFIKF